MARLGRKTSSRRNVNFEEGNHRRHPHSCTLNRMRKARQVTYRKLARPERFELPTYSSGGCRSIQLSYGRASTSSSLQPIAPSHQTRPKSNAASTPRDQAPRVIKPNRSQARWSAGSGQTAVTASPTMIPIDTSMNRCSATIHGGAVCGMSITMASVMPAKR